MLLVRRVAGSSMAPALRPGQVVVGSGRKRLRRGDIVIIEHDGLEKIKRIADMREGQVFVLGDNAAQSTDSRHFGWIPLLCVRAKLVWPRS